MTLLPIIGCPENVASRHGAVEQRSVSCHVAQPPRRPLTPTIPTARSSQRFTTTVALGGGALFAVLEVVGAAELAAPREAFGAAPGVRRRRDAVLALVSGRPRLRRRYLRSDSQ